MHFVVTYVKIASVRTFKVMAIRLHGVPEQT